MYYKTKLGVRAEFGAYHATAPNKVAAWRDLCAYIKGQQ